MSTTSFVATLRSATGIVVAPIVIASAGLAADAPAVVILGALALAVMAAARRLGRERGAYAALVAAAMFAGVYASTHHGAPGSPGRAELGALVLLLGIAVIAAEPRAAVRRRDDLPAPTSPFDAAVDVPAIDAERRSEVPDAGRVPAHDERSFVGRDARELLVDERA